MVTTLPIAFSAVVVCYNEAKWVRQCLGSLDFCKELIVVDLGSTDGSQEIARGMGAKVFQHERVPHPNVPRQYGISQAQHEWVFTIDMDEVFPKEEISKVETIIIANPNLDAIRVPIQYYFKRKKLICTVWGRPGHTRWTVLHRDRAQGTPYAHQEFRLDQNIHYFSWSEMTPIKHYWRNSYRELFAKMWPYIRLEGESKYASGYRFSWLHLIKATVAALKSNLIGYKGLWGGFTGISLSFAYTWYVFMSWLSLRRYETARKVSSTSI